VRWLAEPDLHLAHTRASAWTATKQTCVKPGLYNADNQVTYALYCDYKNKEMLTQLCRSSANPNRLMCENLKKIVHQELASLHATNSQALVNHTPISNFNAISL
jgi:hypothetical protein